MSGAPFGKFAAQARRIRRTPVWELAGLFDRWMSSPPDPGDGFRERIFSLSATFWLFFSPGDLRGLLLQGDGAQGHGVAVGRRRENHLAQRLGLLPGEKTPARVMA